MKPCIITERFHVVVLHPKLKIDWVYQNDIVILLEEGTFGAIVFTRKGEVGALYVEASEVMEEL